MIKYGNRTITMEQNWNILEINPRSNETKLRCTIIFKFDFLRKKAFPTYFCTFISNMDREKPNEKCQDQR